MNNYNYNNNMNNQQINNNISNISNMNNCNNINNININNNINNEYNNNTKNSIEQKEIPEYETIDTESDPLNKYIENAINYSSLMKCY